VEAAPANGAQQPVRARVQAAALEARARGGRIANRASASL
jgi:hypothetical protein